MNKIIFYCMYTVFLGLISSVFIMRCQILNEIHISRNIFAHSVIVLYYLRHDQDRGNEVQRHKINLLLIRYTQYSKFQINSSLLYKVEKVN